MGFWGTPCRRRRRRGSRRSRYVILVVGLSLGLELVIGATLGLYWPLAIGGIFVLCLGAAVLSAHTRIGLLVLLLAVPMVGGGLSFNGDVAAAGVLATVMALGAVYGWLVSLCWPERPTGARPEPPLHGQAATVEYGVRLGLAGALCAAVGFALDLDHKGWATAACLLVMRPDAEMTRLRGEGRAISVTAGTARVGGTSPVGSPHSS